MGERVFQWCAKGHLRGDDQGAAGGGYRVVPRGSPCPDCGAPREYLVIHYESEVFPDGFPTDERTRAYLEAGRVFAVGSIAKLSDNRLAISVASSDAKLPTEVGN